MKTKNIKLMLNEFFPPNEEELDDMIREVQEQMDEAESQAEWSQLNYELQQLLKKQIVPPKNSAL